MTTRIGLTCALLLAAALLSPATAIEMDNVHLTPMVGQSYMAGVEDGVYALDAAARLRVSKYVPEAEFVSAQLHLIHANRYYSSRTYGNYSLSSVTSDFTWHLMTDPLHSNLHFMPAVEVGLTYVERTAPDASVENAVETVQDQTTFPVVLTGMAMDWDASGLFMLRAKTMVGIVMGEFGVQGRMMLDVPLHDGISLNVNGVANHVFENGLSGGVEPVNNIMFENSRQYLFVFAGVGYQF
ncbi:hypothetical protein KQI52_07200 [bacterium]|nr:hypothetical protein [bacterium]